jgi:NAD(P)-dependent dehydrogenase (short-subunit alcohol dehydrogenase family)/acyl carrier protein
VYLITGGLGGIGLALAAHLADTVGARLVLLGRTALPPREQWPQILATEDTSSGVARRVKIVSDLEAHGAEVLVVQADVANATQVRAAVQQALMRFGAIHGVFHAAGVPGIGIIQLKTPEAAARVLAPKVQGALALEQALRDVSLDFMALFSSITSATGGGPGQIDYCAANAFLDAFARHRNATHGQTTAISWSEWRWDAWQAGLQGYDEITRTMLITNRRAYGIRFEEGMDALQRALASDLPHVFVSSQDLTALLRMTRQAFATSPAQTQRKQQSLYRRPELGTSYAAPSSELEKKIAATWSAVLGIEQIGINDNFFELGGNSLLGIDLIARLRKLLGIEKLPTHVLYDAPSVSALAKHIDRSQHEPVSVQDFKERADKQRETLKQFKRRI